MPDIPATNIDTSGVVGQAGAIPIGTQYAQPGTTDTANEATAAYGSTTARPNPPGMSGTPDTEAVYGPNHPESFSPVSLLLSGTRDTTQGFAGNMSAPVYRAPSGSVPASIKDTTNALGFVAAVPAENYPWITNGTTETAYFGAPSGRIISGTDNLTIDQTTPAAATKQGVIGAANTLVVVNNGHVTTVTAESHVLSGLTAFTLTHPGVTDTTAAIVVKKGATVLTVTTDYTIAATGSGITRNMTITPIDSAIVDSGDTLTVDYHYGNTAYFTPATLTLTTDYTVTFTASSAQRTFTILRTGASSNVANGDSVAVTYNFGDATYWGTHDPTTVPPAPVIGTAVAGDRNAKVVWTLPSLAATDDIDGFLIQTDTGGTRYVPGQYLNFLFETLVPGQPYKFRVAAFNEAGLSVFSALSNAVTPLNYDEVPTGSLDPKNTINPIYNADGTIVDGTGLGV